MYFTTTSPGFGSAAAPALCPADQPIDAGAALLFSNQAPLAAGGGSGCDHKAIWTFVPAQRPSLSVHVYLHGNNNLVTADAAHPGGRQADWAPRRTPSSLRPGGPFAAGPKYEMDRASQASLQKPVVLVPEDAVAPPPGNSFWAVGAQGSFAGNPGQLGTMIQDSLARLRRLPSPLGTPYLTAPFGPFTPEQSQLRRLYLSGHSGGGKPLSACAGSTIARSLPTDLWLYDCTYWSQHVAQYVAFAEAWSRSGKLGNGPGMSRMVILVTGDPRTTNNAVVIVRHLEKSLSTRRVRLTRRGLTAPSGTIVEAMRDASVPGILSALRVFPVCLIHTAVTHDQIPRVWTPRLLTTAQ